MILIYKSCNVYSYINGKRIMEHILKEDTVHIYVCMDREKEQEKWMYYLKNLRFVV